MDRIYKPQRILILGDTHRQDIIAQNVIEDEKPYDMMLHTGDAEGSEGILERAAGVPCRFISGNGDFTAYPYDDIFMIGPYRTMLTHGHTHRISAYGIDVFAEELAGKDIRILIHGHTHVPRAEYHKGVLVLSPGSLAYPRQEGRKRTYMILTMDAEGKLNYELKAL